MTTAVDRYADPVVRGLLDQVPTGLLIEGRWRPAEDGQTFPVTDPATGAVLAEVAEATPEDAMAALRAAASAQEEWGQTAPRERAELLRRSFEALVARRDEFAMLMTLEMGKPLSDSFAELDYGAEFLRWFSEEAVRIDGGYLRSPNGATRVLVTRQPVGPALLITPWNFPLAMATRKIAPAIAAGCTSLLKPSELTPLTSLLFIDLLIECGLPPGVVNVVTTTHPAQVTGPVLEDGRIRKLSFTGSTEVGKILLASAAKKVVRTSMELGGNAPFLVFDDADLDEAVEGAVIAKMRNMGEACTAANRIYVAREIAHDFAELLGQRLGDMRLGHGLDPGTQVGPLIDEATISKVSRLVGDAVSKGADIITGGSRRDGAGHFFEPTVLNAVSADADVMREEVFGPVAPVVPFDDPAQAIEWANNTEYGLVAYAYTRDVGRALAVSDALKVGMVGLNVGVVSNAAAPFGGVKESGIGREGGFEGIKEFLDTKYVAMRT